MKRGVAAALVVLGCVESVPGIGLTAVSDDHAEAARKARDSGDTEALHKLIDGARRQAEQQKSAASYQMLAQFDLWLCEAGHMHNDNKTVKQAAQGAATAADQAIALDPNSSEAHRLEGQALAELIPHVFAGGPRYGPRSTKEIEKALELDPKNANACVARGINYFLTPKAFGGNHQKAVEMLKKAIELDPRSDTAHIWLAQVYLADGQPQDALREINEARQLDPNRGFTHRVYQQMTAG
ncbi:MAG TPA: tetratricopeptide repeat protein [Terriglobia bacterium]